MHWPAIPLAFLEITGVPVDEVLHLALLSRPSREIADRLTETVDEPEPAREPVAAS